MYSLLRRKAPRPETDEADGGDAALAQPGPASAATLATVPEPAANG
jgi:hypothetical protein